MSLLDYARSLLPSFTKNEITESVSLTSHALETTTIPAVLAAESYFSENPLSSKDALNLVAIFSKRVPAQPGASIVSTISQILQNSLSVLAWVGKESKNVYSNQETNVAITYTKATLLRLIEAAEFAGEYALKFVNQLYILETEQIDPLVKLKNQLAPAEVQWLEAHYLDFLLALSVLGRPVKDIEKAIKELPDADITEMTETMFPQTIGQKAMDPFALRNMSAAINPFYLFGMMRAEKQAALYKAKKAELELLQLRHLNLVKLKEKTPDASLQKQIDYMADRVSRLNYDVDKMKKEWLKDNE